MRLILRHIFKLVLLVAVLGWLSLITAAGIQPSLVELVQKFDEKLAFQYNTILATQFEGRRAGTPSGRAAAEFVATEFQKMGLQPAGDHGTYFQNFEMPYLELAETPELTLLDEAGRTVRTFQHRLDFREFIFGNAGQGRAEAEVVYVGAGSHGEFSSVNVANKIALITRRGNTGAIVAEALRQGALGILFLASNDVRVQIKSSYLIDLASQNIPSMTLTRATVNAILARTGQSVDAVTNRGPFATGVRVRMSIKLQPIVNVTVSNVLALLLGTDPQLKNKVVLIGGHYDHVGRDPNGTVFQGANDNASGPSVVMAIAQLLIFQRVRPKASILFVGWGAEEAGLVGSDFYVKNPKYSLSQTLASLVLDVVGRGEGTHLNSEGDPNSLLETVRSSGEALKLQVNTQNGGGGSDHEPFLDAKVPAVLFEWEDSIQTIHRADDTIEKIDPEKLRVTGMVAALTALTLTGIAP
ncbi:M28 family peptidase [Candidatus Acetothermia bacterium]|nr:M28 family peptidase [Candidatus Acetothermia bacterium]